MKKIVVINLVLIELAFLAGCSLKSASQNQITTPSPLAQQPAQPAKNRQSAAQPTDKIVNWKTYQGDKYGFSFSYPSNFKMITDKIQIEYIGHPKGFNWYRIQLTDASAPEKPFMTFEIDADGYGPFFPDKTYQISETNAGRIVINSISASDSEFSKDGRILIASNPLKSSNEHSYAWQFSYNESDKDYEPLFKRILSTFKFKKLTNPDLYLRQNPQNNLAKI